MSAEGRIADERSRAERPAAVFEPLPGTGAPSRPLAGTPTIRVLHGLGSESRARPGSLVAASGTPEQEGVTE
ncbi:hypothetical protein [Streptomyces sp. NPDC005303]|uniref:hypothetical protein n=1 Tax=Streptomyces sp. NPDC005303 TaxID=3155713 RepID=UPI0033ACC376